MLCSAGTLMAQEVIRTEHGVKLEVPGGTFRCEVQFYTPSIVRVVKYPQAEMPEEKSLAVVLAPEEVKFNVKVADDVVTLKSSELTVTLDKQGGTVALQISRVHLCWRNRGHLHSSLVKTKSTKGIIVSVRLSG